MKLKSVFLAAVILLSVCTVLALVWYERGWMSANLLPQPAYQMGKDPNQYATSLQKIKTQKTAWRAQKIPAVQLSKSFTQIFKSDVLAYWYGTSWDFYGTSETPQSGTIACGYFVTTTLRDMACR